MKVFIFGIMFLVSLSSLAIEPIKIDQPETEQECK